MLGFKFGVFSTMEIKENLLLLKAAYITRDETDMKIISVHKLLFSCFITAIVALLQVSMYIIN